LAVITETGTRRFFAVSSFDRSPEFAGLTRNPATPVLGIIPLNAVGRARSILELSAPPSLCARASEMRVGGRYDEVCTDRHERAWSVQSDAAAMLPADGTTGQLTAGRAPPPPPPHPACPPARAPPRRPGRRGAAAGKTALAAAAGHRERRRPGWLLLVSERATGFHVFVFYDRSAGARRGAEYRRTRNIVINTAVL